MICTEAAEFVSALCDGEIIPPVAAEHIGTCPGCQAQLRDYLAMGVELRRTASLEQSASIPAHTPDHIWTRPQNPLKAFLQKGWGTMRIPRLAFAAMIAGIVALASTLAVVKVGANSNGTVVLLTTTGSNGRSHGLPLVDAGQKPSCLRLVRNDRFADLAYRVRLLSREKAGLARDSYANLLKGENLSSFTFDADSAAKVKEIWFEPGEQLKVDVADVGTLTLTGEWMDHMPILIGLHGQDMSPGPGEIRFASPLLLKDKKLVGDLVGFSVESSARMIRIWASWMYIPGQGQFSDFSGANEGRCCCRCFPQPHLLPGRRPFLGICDRRADYSRRSPIWVLHQPQFKPATARAKFDRVIIGTQKLMQTEPGVWEPAVPASGELDHRNFGPTGIFLTIVRLDGTSWPSANRMAILSLYDR